ncbi:unnamed protein product, partial [Dibothriocephalus latus]
MPTTVSPVNPLNGTCTAPVADFWRVFTPSSSCTLRLSAWSLLTVSVREKLIIPRLLNWLTVYLRLKVSY